MLYGHLLYKHLLQLLLKLKHLNYFHHFLAQIIYYIGQELAKTNRDVAEYISMIKKVSKEDIINLANTVQINTIYFLRN